MSANDYTAFKDGEGQKNVAVAGTPERLSAAQLPCRAVVITARSGNTGKIAYGFQNDVRATPAGEVGGILGAGQSVSIPCTDVSNVWIDAEIGGNGVSFTYKG